MEVDVAIIGAGPAGSTLAALLARRGVKVGLYDKETFPRDKLCGEFLSYDALPLLAELGGLDALDRAGAPHINRGRIVGRHRTYEFPLASPARGVSRLLLDATLLDCAVKAGAQFEVRTVSSLSDCSAKVIVGAWGRWGRFDKQLERSFVEDRNRNFGFKRHYQRHGERAADGSIDLYSFDRGYLGVNAVEGGVTNICGLVHASRLSGHKGRWDSFIETIRDEEPQLDRLYAGATPAQPQFLSSDPVIFRPRSSVEGGVFMIGDASGVIDPLTGNGMSMAMQSAFLVAPHLLRLLEAPQQRARIEDEYRDAHRAFFSDRIHWSRIAARLLTRPRLLDTALFALRSPAFGALFSRKTRASQEDIDLLLAHALR